MSDFELTECKDNSRESKEYWDKRIKENWDKPFHGMFLDSPELIKKMDDRNFKIIEEQITSIYTSNGKRQLKVLEAGCGNGRYIDRLIKNNQIANYTGFDFVKQSIIEAKDKYEGNTMVELYCTDMMTAHEFFAGKEFDMIFMVATLTSIQRNFYTIIKNLKKLLTKNSCIYIFEQDMFIQYWGNWKEL